MYVFDALIFDIALAWYALEASHGAIVLLSHVLDEYNIDNCELKYVLDAGIAGKSVLRR